MSNELPKVYTFQYGGDTRTWTPIAINTPEVTCFWCGRTRETTKAVALGYLINEYAQIACPYCRKHSKRGFDHGPWRTMRLVTAIEPELSTYTHPSILRMFDETPVK